VYFQLARCILCIVVLLHSLLIFTAVCIFMYFGLHSMSIVASVMKFFIVINSYSLFLFVVGRVAGFTCLDNRLYVIYGGRPTIHVYTADTFSEVSVIAVHGLMYPRDIMACHDDRQLYVSDEWSSIWRVSAVNPTDYERWLSVDESLPGFSTMSLTSQRLVVTSPWSRSLHQYSTVNKQLLRDIQLPDSVRSVTHAVETSRDTFVISHDAPYRAVSELLSFILCLLVLHQQYIVIVVICCLTNCH